MTKGIVYYTDCRPSRRLLDAVREQIVQASHGLVTNLQCVALRVVEGFGHLTVLHLERGYLTMFRQILAGLEAIDTDVVFLCEHDVLYHHYHFKFTPPHDDVYFYNEHTYKVDAETGRAVFYHTKQTSGLCASRELLLTHYRERVKRVEHEGFSRRMGFEPGTHGRAERIDDVKAEAWMSAFPNIDIRHKHNLTESRWSPEQFRNQRSCRGWKEVDTIPGWGRTRDVLDSIFQGVAHGV